MQRFCLTIARLSLAAWVGAATLFVATSIREQLWPGFDQTLRDALALLRFPYYYGFGFALTGTALVCGLVAATRPQGGRRMGIALGLVLGAVVLMLADYFWVYQPLVEMITPPGRTRPPGFDAYHKASMYVNLLDVGMCAIAAWLLAWPRRTDTAGPSL